MPPALRYLLTWFGELGQARQQSDMGGPKATSWAELQAWAWATGVQLQPWEAQALRQLDALWITAWAAGREKPAKRVSD